MLIGGRKDAALDKLAAAAGYLDPRLRIAADDPECFMCGKKVRRAVALTVETGASIGMHAHEECIGGKQAWEVCARYWQAMRAAITGEKETPNPGPPRISYGAFV